MLVYWFLFVSAAIGVALQRPDPDPRKPLGALLLAFVLITVLVGLRFEVGADWKTYEFIFREIGYRRFDEVLLRPETGFQLLNWAVHALGADVRLVNLVCAAIFASGLIAFSRSQADPWLTILAACPYLITVVAMGYTRQAVAIGLLLFGLASFFRRPSALRFAGWAIAAAMFHRSAVFAFPLVAFAVPRNRLLNIGVGIASCYVLWDMFLADTMQNYVRNYVDAGYSSQGAAIRIALSVMAALILLGSRGRLQFSPTETAVWRNFAFASLALFAGLAILPSSTAIDRLGLYVIPLQLAVLARVPILFRDWKLGRATVVMGEGVVLFAWLNFAVHARYWVPYRFYPF